MPFSNRSLLMEVKYGKEDVIKKYYIQDEVHFNSMGNEVISSENIARLIPGANTVLVISILTEIVFDEIKGLSSNQFLIKLLQHKSMW